MVSFIRLLIGATGMMLAASLPAQSVIDDHIRIDQIGYQPNDQKIAVITDPQTGYNAPDPYTPGATLEVRKASDNSIIFSGTPVAWNGGATHTQSGDKAWWFDFSAVTATDDYYINDPANNTRSYEFRIAPDVYNDALKHAVRMFYYQRCGTPKSTTHAGANYDDTDCHLGSLQDLDCRDVTDPSNISLARDLSGGWHDAGDYNKYTNFTLAPVHYLLDAYEQRPAVFGDNTNIPESGNGVPDILDEVKWELDWLLKMQNPDGSALMKVSTLGFTGGSPPSTDNAQRLYGAAASSATRTVCSQFAHAAIIFSAQSSATMQAYGDTLLAHAILAWNWLQNNPGYSNYANTGFSSANPEVSNYQQDATKFAAAIYLFAATGNATYRTYVDNNYANIQPMQWTYWYPFESIVQDAMLYYTNTPGATTAAVNAIRANCITSVSANNNELLPAYTGQDDPYMAHMQSNDYVWGNNQFKCETGSIFGNMVRYALDTPNQTNYRNAAEGYVHYIHGVNAVNYCFLTNGPAFGADRSVLQIYHGWFGDGTMYDSTASYIGPPPGYLPGGVNASYSPDAAYSGPPISPPQNQPVQKCYKDWNTSWPENSWEISEIAIYTNAAYVKLLSGFADSVVMTSAQNVPGAAAWSVYPNPAKNFITISGQPNAAVTIELYDVNGKLVLQKNCSAGENIPVASLQAGIYFCMLRDAAGTLATQKIAVSH